jgi:two-component system, sensor histidine kinase PdtaS
MTRVHNKRTLCLPAAIIILVAAPLFCFSQTYDDDHLQLLAQLRTRKADTSRVHLLLKLGQYYLLREYYLYKTGNPRTQLDSASYFAEEAINLSQNLQYENGRNEAILLKGDAFARKRETDSAINLLSTLHDSTRFRLLIILGRHYLFHSDKSNKKNLDSSRFFLEQASKIDPNNLPEKWRNERIHVEAIHAYLTRGIEPSKNLYLQLIDKINMPGNEEREALLWHELTVLIPLHNKTGITRLYCFEKMRSLYNKSGNKEREAWVLKTIADIHLVNGKYDLAETELLYALELYKAIEYRDLHYIYDLLAATYRYKGDFSKCIFYGLKTVESIETTNDTTSAITFYGRLADMYRELGQPEKSVEWYSKMLSQPAFKNSDGRNDYIFRNAGFFARELIKIRRENEALAYILDINAKKKPASVYAETCLVSSLAYCYHAVKQERNAEKYYLELIKLAEQLQKDYEINADINYEIGRYFMDKLQYGKAAAYLQKALNASKGTNSLSVNKDIYLMLYKTDSAIGNYFSATQHLLQHKLFSDSIFNETKNWQIEELQIQYETAKKEKNIELLNNQSQLQSIRVEQANKTKNITLGGAILLLIIIGLLFNRYRIKQRSNHKLEIQQRELDQKNIFLETLNAEQNRLLKEKEWLIKEVHHRVKNNLQMMISLLNTQSAYLSDDGAVIAVKDSLRRIQAISLIHQKLYQAENISSIAMPEYINDLVHYVRDSFDTGNQIVFEQAIEPLDLDVSHAVPLGLIINECIVNAVKYAFPNGRKGIVSINLHRDGDDHLLLKVSDNGIGLPESVDITGHNSLGLDLMQGLAKQLNGSFRIKNNNGLHVMIRFIAFRKQFPGKGLVNF